MNLLATTILVAVPLLPWLMALPRYRSLKTAHLIAMSPLLTVLLLPSTTIIELPWLLTGVSLMVDANAKLLLLVLAALWWVIFMMEKHRPSTATIRSLLLFAMGASFAAVLANDLLVLFLMFTLLGYSFYVIIVCDGNEVSRRVGRVFLVLQIAADLLLFELMVMLAKSSGALDFYMLRETLLQASSQSGLLWFALLFVLAKAGLWPLHFWQALLGREQGKSWLPLVGLMFVIIALFSLQRMLPLGEVNFPTWGVVLQVIGFAALAYAVVVGVMQRQLSSILAYLQTATAALLLAVLGVGLAQADVWQQLHTVWITSLLQLALVMAALVIMTTASSSPGDNRYTMEMLGISASALLVLGLFLVLHSPLVWAVFLLSLLLGRVMFVALNAQHAVEPKSVENQDLRPVWKVLLILAVVVWPVAMLLSVVSLAILFTLFWIFAWVLLLAVLVNWLVKKKFSLQLPDIPPGDLLIWIERICAKCRRYLHRFGFEQLPVVRDKLQQTIIRWGDIQFHQRLLPRAEKSLQSWATAGLLFVLLGAVFVFVVWN